MTTPFHVAIRNLRHHWRSHLATLAAVAVGAMTLAGALFVGDSLRGSLTAKANRQSNGVTAALVSQKLLSGQLAPRLGADVVTALMLQGTANVETAAGFSSERVTIIGLDAAGMLKLGMPTTEGDDATLSQSVAAKLMPLAIGKNPTQSWPSRVQLTVQQFSTVPRGSLLGKRNTDDLTSAISFKPRAVLPESHAANDFALTPSTSGARNVFVPLETLQRKLKQTGKVNVLLSSGGIADALTADLTSKLTPADWGLRIQVPPVRKAYVSVEAEQLLLPDAVVDAALKVAKKLNAQAEPTTVYLANWIKSDDAHRIPYSVIAAVNPEADKPLGPFAPPDVTLKDNEIILTDWNDSPLKDVPLGSAITIDYFEPEVESRVVERSVSFKLAGRIPLDGAARDPDLSPPFPGITDKLRIGDWNPPFPFDNSRIKPGDIHEKYWDKHRTTPKAYITRAAGKRLFSSRFGSTTSVRIAPPDGMTPQDFVAPFSAALQKEITPQSLGLQFEDTAARRAAASVGGTDFGGLFLGFSFFLILAALVLVALFVRLGVERRAKELGTLAALGFAVKHLRNGLFTEIFFVGLAGAALGLALAMAYTEGLLALLGSLWPDTSLRSFLVPHYRARSAYYGSFGALELSLLAAWLAVRKLVKQPVPSLMRGQVESRSTSRTRRKWVVPVAVLAFAAGVGAIIAGLPQANPDLRAMCFFLGGQLIFLSGLMLIRVWLQRDAGTSLATIAQMAHRNAARNLNRSTLTVFLIGSATFLLLAVESFRRDPGADFAHFTGGSGGFNLLAEADIPLFNAFNTEPGRSDFLDALDKERQRANFATTREEAAAILSEIEGVIPLRRRQGDDASCLNLYQAGKPRLLGVPNAMIDRGGFRFAETLAETAEERANPWLLLKKPQTESIIPVFGEMNSVMWMLKKAVGDVVEAPDETGTLRKFRIVGTLQDSPFQSELLMSESNFTALFPYDEGSAAFLIQSHGDENALSQLLETGLRSHGLLVSSTRARVAEFQKVVSTYLTTFQMLGGLGLLLGVLGMAAITLRGVWERVGEFALLRSVGWTPADLRRVILLENLLLLTLGLVLGLASAIISVAPQALATGVVPWKGITLLAIIVLALGFAVVSLATRSVLAVKIIDGLRAE